MRNPYALAVVPFAWAMIGADSGDGCALTEIGQPVPPPASTLPVCYTDPPQGCYAYCYAADDEEFTDACSSVAAGPRTQAFEDDASLLFQALLNQGTHLCTGSNSGDAGNGVRATPCQLGYPPLLWPNQDPESCFVPAPGCSW